MDTRDFITALGGYRSVASHLGKGATTVHTHMQAGKLPAAWYDALCRLAGQKGVAMPSRSLFTFLALGEGQPRDKKDAAA